MVNDEPWWKSAVVYQIYPRSFMDASGDGGGDLEGVLQRLDYLNDGTERSLGVDALWLSPVYPSPMVDFGYDISDYCDIHPLFGSLDTFKRLLEEAHRRGIRVLMDLVLNHTSDQHPWFKEARASRTSPKRDWYVWHDGVNGKPPNNWYTFFSGKPWKLGGSTWEWDEPTRQYYLHSFCVEQPDLNWRNPEVRAAARDVVRFWLDLGVDGFRMDVVNWVIKDDAWRSNPVELSLTPPDWQRHVYDRNRPETHEVLKEIRRWVDAWPDKMLVGEVFLNDAREAVSYQGQGDELHMAFNFAFLFQPWKARAFWDRIVEYEGLLPEGAWPNYTLSNHDQPRHFSRYGKGEESLPRARVAAAMLLTLRGTPFVYYGEELGMSDLKLSREEIQDPPGRMYWPFFKGRDPARSPMQWSAGPNAGFSKGTPWLKVHPGHERVNVESQADDPESLLSFYRRFIWARKATPALQRGTFVPLKRRPDDVLAWMREHEGQRAVVLLNFSGKEATVELDQVPEGAFRVLVSTHAQGQLELRRRMRLARYEVLVLLA